MDELDRPAGCPAARPGARASSTSATSTRTTCSTTSTTATATGATGRRAGRRRARPTGEAAYRHKLRRWPGDRRAGWAAARWSGSRRSRASSRSGTTWRPRFRSGPTPAGPHLGRPLRRVGRSTGHRAGLPDPGRRDSCSAAAWCRSGRAVRRLGRPTAASTSCACRRPASSGSTPARRTRSRCGPTPSTSSRKASSSSCSTDDCTDRREKEAADLRDILLHHRSARRVRHRRRRPQRHARLEPDRDPRRRAGTRQRRCLTGLWYELPERTRYSYIYNGESEALDHVYVTNLPVGAAALEAPTCYPMHVEADFPSRRAGLGPRPAAGDLLAAGSGEPALSACRAAALAANAPSDAAKHADSDLRRPHRLATATPTATTTPRPGSALLSITALDYSAQDES